MDEEILEESNNKQESEKIEETLNDIISDNEYLETQESQTRRCLWHYLILLISALTAVLLILFRKHTGWMILGSVLSIVLSSVILYLGNCSFEKWFYLLNIIIIIVVYIIIKGKKEENEEVNELT